MKILRAVLSVFIFFSIIYSVFFAKSILTESTEISAKEYKAVLSVWQIDVFEGGRGSRRQFIGEMSKKFEKQRQGVFVLVSSHTVSSAEERMSKGEFPDVISFGVGVNVSDMKEISGLNSDFGKIGSSVFAVPWCRGGYVLIENPESNNDVFVVSQAEYTQPLLAAYFNRIDVGKYSVKKPMDAYVDFVSGKAKFFLGTQRDVIRIESRGMNTTFNTLDYFSDLYQYMSITSADKYELSCEFLEFMTSETVESELYRIGMSAIRDETVFENQTLSQMQSKKISVSVSPFIGSVKAKELQELSVKLISGDENAKNKIKKMLSNLENPNEI